MKAKPFFYDVTLRDGNQALKKPWNLKQKEIIFNSLIELGVQGIEVGFASASELDFEACSHLSSIAPETTVISSLSRANKKEIEISWNAIKHAPKPRIHIVYPVSKFAIENILKIPYSEVLKNAVNSVLYAKEISKGRASIQFSGEHFGDSRENIGFVIALFQAVAEAGADVINLPNTVERYRPSLFIDMVRLVSESLPQSITVSVHTHNDLGMATATTVESYFAGAVQLETALNGLGERAGNTNFYEVACALYNCGVEPEINFKNFVKASKIVSELSGIPIHEKAPIIGEDVFSHRSGIHQDGVAKTIQNKKNAYGAINPELIGRSGGHKISFTSQSGSKAVQFILKEIGIDVSDEEAKELQPIFKKYSEMSGGELSKEDILNAYNQLPQKISSVA
ncbi:MAG: 2-isopropylmalate synthase [Leptospiraceae bacterium]|nr:2-isopropylmalate synthase [Leptospiraceae bacterium]